MREVQILANAICVSQETALAPVGSAVPGGSVVSLALTAVCQEGPDLSVEDDVFC